MTAPTINTAKITPPGARFFRGGLPGTKMYPADHRLRQLRSVANMTRQDARDFLRIAADIGLRPKVTVFALEQANQALEAVKADAIDGAAVIVP